jgi:RNA polymerase sigma-70 factor (ECF subfamily)
MTLQNCELAYGLAESEPREPSLVERLRLGEPSAIGEAYDLHHGAVRAFARRLLGDPAVAEDLVHEVFVRLPEAIRGFREEAALRTFLISIAVNRARRFTRSRARERAALERMSSEPPPSGAETPEQLVRRRELAQALSRALASLPLDQRVAFVLCEVEQRSSGEAAMIVGVPEGTVRTRLFHARRKLREALAEQEVR